MMVGDYIHDVEAGRRAGCVTTFIQRKYALAKPELADYHCHDLRELLPKIADRQL